MKKYLVISILAFASCTGNGDKKTDTSDTIKVDTSKASTINEPQQNKEYCFVLTEGIGNKDTTAVHLVINADKLSGEMNWLPKEKDRRKGTLTGTIAGDEIRAVWSFMQEGMKDSISVAFKLSSQQLAQKPLKVNTANGRQDTDESAGYTLLYKPTDCSQSK